MVNSGGTAIGTMLKGGQQIIFSGGAAASTIIGDGANAECPAGGVLNSATVKSGGVLQLDTGALATAITVLSGGFELARRRRHRRRRSQQRRHFEWSGNGQDTTGMAFRPGAILQLKANHVGSDNISSGITEELLTGARRAAASVLSAGVVDV